MALVAGDSEVLSTDSEPPHMVQSKSSPAFDSVEFATEAEVTRAKCSWFPRWVPTSGLDLAQAESRLLQPVNAKIERKYVPVTKGQLWTAIVNRLPTADKDNEQSPKKNTPLVLVHGFGGGLGLWMNNFFALCADRTVYAIDVLGFGRSSRPKFSTDAGLVELEWVESLEDWRKQLGLEEMILLGHSLGGFIVASYALEYPQHVRHLILADPWGLPPKPPSDQMTFRGRRPSRWMLTVATLLSQFNPLAGVRVAGPWGPRLVRKARPDLGVRYASEFIDQDTIFDYIYHCNAQKPSGETAFRQLVDGIIWAKRAMRDRLTGLDPSVPISFLYGDTTWMNKEDASVVKAAREGHHVTVALVENAGHQVFADNPEHFNRLVTDICTLVDNDGDRMH